MSWDVIVLNMPIVWQILDDIPVDWQPTMIGIRSEIIAKILEVAPSADFSDPSWGHIKLQDSSVEVSMGKDNEVSSFVFHIRGGDTAVDIIADILTHLNLSAFDPNSPTGFFDRIVSKGSLTAWRNYRDYIVELVTSDDLNSLPSDVEQSANI